MPTEKTPFEKMLEALARKLGKALPTNPDQDPLGDVLLDAVQDVKNFCNLEELPEALHSTVVRIAMDMWRGAGYGQDAAPKQVTAVKRGDVQTSFAAPGYAGGNSGGGVDYKTPYLNILYNFRKVVY